MGDLLWSLIWGIQKRTILYHWEWVVTMSLLYLYSFEMSNISHYSLIKLFKHMTYNIIYFLITRYICCACERSLDYIECDLWMWVMGLSHKVIAHNPCSSKLWDSSPSAMELGIPFAKDYYTEPQDLPWLSEAKCFRLMYRCYALNGSRSCLS
jgi:hypothetical protein